MDEDWSLKNRALEVLEVLKYIITMNIGYFELMIQLSSKY